MGEGRRDAGMLHLAGGSPLGNSRVKLTNQADCVKRKLVKEGEDPQDVAASQLLKDEIDVLHSIGGDTVGADLAEYLKKKNHNLTVLGLAKTIDNDVFSVKQTFGAWTAAEEGAKYFANVVYESSANPRMLIVHEVMGALCGYLTAATAEMYRNIVHSRGYCKEIGLSKERYDVHAVFIPEIPFNIQAEAARLKETMKRNDCVNIFLSEGAGIDEIAAEMESNGQTLPRNAFGKVLLDSVNPGAWFAKKFAAMIGAEKVLVQKSGYFSRSSKPNNEDMRLIKSCTDHAVECAIRGESGIVAHDEDQHDVLRAIEFDRVKGGKPFNTSQPWFQQMLSQIGQKMEYAPGTMRQSRVLDVTEEEMNSVKIRMNCVKSDKRNSTLYH